ncbi:LppP/LprE family lipoprotein [Actinomyces weissii]|uniref:LppP/LprE family lipoprotein n=2 Tax=Actinomyces weissii TaxID=675090 RepID=A0A7T7S2E9_9ACTO|nr:LppP/LprE family lipoprotein [Actinomyces weissii]
MSAEAPAVTSAPDAPTQAATPAPATLGEATRPPSDDDCSGMTGAEAVARWGGEVATFGEDEGWQWNLEGADTSTYDQCAELSWVVLGIKGGTASSPYQIMLFHDGQYVGVTSEKSIGFLPQVSRIDDDEIQVTYTWPKDGESNDVASGRSVSVFEWEDDSNQVVHKGEWPPYVQ